MKEDSAAASSRLNPLVAVFRMAADMSRVDFGKAAWYRNMIRRKYALPLLFMELDQLLLIISSPKSTSQDVGGIVDYSSVASDKDILQYNEAGKPCEAVANMKCPLEF